jgi:hypothetical protein
VCKDVDRVLQNNIVIVDETEQSALLEAAWMACVMKRNATKFPSLGMLIKTDSNRSLFLLYTNKASNMQRGQCDHK